MLCHRHNKSCRGGIPSRPLARPLASRENDKILGDENVSDKDRLRHGVQNKEQRKQDHSFREKEQKERRKQFDDWKNFHRLP
jgi:hypothetical protein